MAVFPSKRDGWIVFVLWAAVAAKIASVTFLWNVPAHPGYQAAVTVFLLAVAALMLWTTYGTRYIVEERTLRILSGPFRWTIPIDEIRAISPTSDILSSPACSLDRLEILYGARRIMVSPEDKRGFLEALAKRSAGLVVKDDRAQRTT